MTAGDWTDNLCLTHVGTIKSTVILLGVSNLHLPSNYEYVSQLKLTLARGGGVCTRDWWIIMR